MSELITVTIDGKKCQAKEGEFILNVARANDIFVPAICYQTKCTPTLACRLCLVEADGKQVYSCNAKVKDGMEISTSTQNIETERRAIMEVYDVNHPLQCGVCDMSGECELQNYSLYMKVDSQSFAVRDVDRPTSHWGVMDYDPGLCIVCEKCVTVCKDMIGSNALSTVKRGADPLEKSYKENMPKDAYAMWNKLNKNLIGFNEESCIDCGECIAVCPVGALVSHDFKYTSNAWELSKIPASNPHSSDCALMYYEVKTKSISEHDQKKIYRVTNDAHYQSLSGAARFGFDYANVEAKKDGIAFAQTVEAFKNASTVGFSSFITNEEAYILQKLKEKFGFKLVNEDARHYKNFLDAFSNTTGKTLYSGNVATIHDANFLISIGSYFKSDAPNVRFAFNNAISMNKGAGLYFHPMNDTSVEGFGKKGKTIETIQYPPMAEEAVLYYILDQFATDLPDSIRDYIYSFREERTKVVKEVVKEKVTEIVKDEESGEEKEVSKMVNKTVEKTVEFTYTKLLDLIGRDESLSELISAMLVKKDKFVLVVGEDLYGHPNSENLARLCGLIEKYTQFSIVLIPSKTNTLGVSQICELDSYDGICDVGYNVKSKFELSSLGDGDIDMPALNQQEGTFTNIDKRVVPTNAALPYAGYTLNDIANELLGSNTEHTIDHTVSIFNTIAFDDLENRFTNAMEEKRGYILEQKDISWKEEIKKVNELKMEGTIIYNANPINQFNEFTAISIQLKSEKTALYISSAYAKEIDVEDGDRVEIEANGVKVTLDVAIDKQLAGSISYVPTFEKDTPTKNLFAGYRYSQANLKKV